MSNKKNWGCFLDLFLLTIVLAILSAIAIPQFTSIKTTPISSLIKNILVNGVKECIVRDADDETTNFVDAASLSLKDSRFKVIAISPNSCFKARGIPEDNTQTWFEIDYDPVTGKVSKTCGDSSKSGCDEGNTW